MSQQNKKMQLLGNAPIPQALLAMGIPTMIGMLVHLHQEKRAHVVVLQESSSYTNVQELQQIRCFL